MSEVERQLRLMKSAPNLVSILQDVLEFLEQQEDADVIDGDWVPNAAMSLAVEVREALRKAGVES